jgi:hypothetical protein
MQTRKLKVLAGIMALMLPCAALVACKGGKSANSADKMSREMPEGAEWKGVYYSQIYGNLHLVEDGGELKGNWRTAAGEAWGEMHGKADGALLKYEWTEHRIGMVGPSAERHGKGYFVYVRPTDRTTKDPDEIHGQWGLGSNESGNKWDAIKQTNLEPDPRSVMPDEVERGAPVVSGGGWDEGSGSSEGKKDDDSDK